MPAAPVPRPLPTAVQSVTQFTHRMRGLLQSQFGEVWIRGEVSQPRPSTAGHLYLTLKDDGATLPCVLWRSTVASLRFRVEEGQEVLVLGGIDVYPPHGKYQLIVRHLEPLGAGALQIAFDQLRKRLEAEGLFDPARKRALPSMPRRIALVTSRQGAAVRDLVTVIRRRFPAVAILLVDVRVQGAGSADEIARGLALADAHARADVIVCGRGGGSLEDLWAFNEEVVARAIAACRTPVVSAVGHETDVTIADLVADVRAATPSQAGELVVPSRDDLLETLRSEARRLHHRMRVRIERAWQRVEALAERPVVRDARCLVAPRRTTLDHLARRLKAQSPLAHLRRRAQRLADLGRSAGRAMRLRLDGDATRLAALEDRLRALSPLAVLARGYSITTRADGRVVRAAADVAPGERLRTRLSDGAHVASDVTAVEPPREEAR